VFRPKADYLTVVTVGSLLSEIVILFFVWRWPWCGLSVLRIRLWFYCSMKHMLK